MTAPRDIPALTGLRGLAVLIVYLSHAANEGWLPAWLGHGFGQMGVQLFFMLSGFLMVHLYADRPLGGAALGRFLAARIGRVVPLYWLVLALSLGFGSLGAFRYRFADSAEFWQAAGFITAPYELWSVPVEVQFYAAFCLLWLLIARRAAAAPIILGIAAISSIGLAFIWRGFVSEADILIPFAHFFLIGGWIAAALRAGYLDRLGGVLSHRAMLPLALAVFALNMPGLRGFELTGGFYPSLWLDPMRIAATAFLFLAALSAPRSPLNWSLFARLGTLSYGIYLFHRPMMQLLDPVLDLPGLVEAALVLALICLLAQASLRGFERPMARLIRRLGQMPRRSLPQAAG